MHSSNAPWIARWWVTPKLNPHYFIIPPERRPKELKGLIRLYFRTWIVHPIKRRIAKYYLLFLQKFFGLTVIGITGSTGKTSTKEMVYSILSQKGKSERTLANIDPTFNIPTTILRCRPSTKYLILEMGVEFPGDMDFYLWLAKPKIGVITNIYQTHTQFFGNTAGVAKEKGKLAEQLGQAGFAVLNKDNAFLEKIAKKTQAHVVWFGKDDLIRAGKTKIMEDFKTEFTLHVAQASQEVTLPLPGSQFVENALAAAAVGYICGATPGEIKNGIENFQIPEHRMRPIRLKNGAVVLDDSYNNNPTAAKLALQTLKEVAGGKEMVVVMGDMLELGKDEKERHKELGRTVAKSGAKYLITVGKLAEYMIGTARKKMAKENVVWCKTVDEVLPVLKPLLKKDTITLIKGSRSIGLDKLVSKLLS